MLSNPLRNEVSSVADNSTTTELAAQIAKYIGGLNQSNQPSTPNNSATKFSNLESYDIDIDVTRIVKSLSIDEFDLFVKDNSTLLS